MPAPPKFTFHGGIYFVTTSVEEGITFPPNETTKELILKSLAQAQGLHNIEIIDIIIQPTHVHMLVRVIDPSDAVDFMERFKTESAHAINRILGRKKKTLWCEGYDSPFIPDIATAIEKIAYLYANPSNDGAVDSINDFPGFNTFYLREAVAAGEQFFSQTYIPTYHIARSDFTVVKDHTPDGYQRYRNRLIQNKKKNSLTISPNALFQKFGITDEAEIRTLNRVIIDEVRRREEKNRTLRQDEGKAVIGAERLAATPIGTHYVPDRTGRRMRVHCVDRELRRATLKWMRELYRRARVVLDRWRIGDFSVPYPIGLFPPTGIRLAEPLGW
jgi:REP element-mobilizing transposase RayT